MRFVLFFGLFFITSVSPFMYDYEYCLTEVTELDSDLSKAGTEDYVDVLALREGNQRRNSIINPWPIANQRILTVHQEHMTENQRFRIDCAISYFNQHTCVDFSRAFFHPRRRPYLYFTYDDTGCYSQAIGNIGGKQIINLDATNRNCWRHGTIMRLIMHALGFLNEQQRNNRDKHVKIQWKNVPRHLQSSYKTAAQLGLTPLTTNEDYDFESIMHSGRFLNNSIVITAKGNPYKAIKDNKIMGNRERPSLGDKQKVNAVYCPQKIVEKPAKQQLDPILLWPNATVPYKLDPNFKYKSDYREKFQCALDFFDKHTCVRFVQKAKNDTEYLRVSGTEHGDSCHSYGYGRSSYSTNSINLDFPLCWDHGTIIHEMMHVLGFIHEQQREDRDEFIEIAWDHIPEDSKHNFMKASDEGYLSPLIGEYDYGSVMHYEGFSYSEKRHEITMSAKKKPYSANNILIARFAAAPTNMDVYKINKMYGCPDRYDLDFETDPHGFVIDDCVN